MALSAEVPRDLSKVKTKVALNLTARQLICFGTGLAFAVPVFFLLKKMLGMEGAAMGCMVTCIPFFLLGLYEKNGLPAEKLIYFAIRAKYLRTGKRPKVIVTKAEEEAKMEEVRKEIAILEKKANRKSRGVKRKPKPDEGADQVMV